jgi:hypothetical protein
MRSRRQTAQGQVPLFAQVAQIGAHFGHGQGIWGAAVMPGQSRHGAQIRFAGLLAEPADDQILLHLGA